MGEEAATAKYNRCSTADIWFLLRCENEGAQCDLHPTFSSLHLFCSLRFLFFSSLVQLILLFSPVHLSSFSSFPSLIPFFLILPSHLLFCPLLLLFLFLSAPVLFSSNLFLLISSLLQSVPLPCLPFLSFEVISSVVLNPLLIRSPLSPVCI